MPPRADIERAKALGLRFYVASKSARSKTYKRLTDAPDLEDAFASARDVQAFEVAIFVEAPPGGLTPSDNRYWTSRLPDTFHSAAF